MNSEQTKLRQKFLTTATTLKRDTGAPDSDLVGAMLSAAHAFALRRDPTPRYIESIFDAPHKVQP